MKRLWEAELARGSRKLRLQTLEELGGAQTIVQDPRRPGARRTFRMKIARRLSISSIISSRHPEPRSLWQRPTSPSTPAAPPMRPAACLSGWPADDTRILRPVPPPPGRTDETRFEISHDLLASAIVDWARRYRAGQLERQVQTEKGRGRLFLVLAIASAVLLVVAIILAATVR